jgi:hypothetical protein
MLPPAFRALRFLWTATRGNRLRPWRSEYLRWRMETYTGKPAASLQLRDFLQLMTSEYRQFVRFLLWTGEIHKLAAPSEDQK